MIKLLCGHMSTDYSKIIADRLSRKDVVRLLDLDSYCMAMDVPVPFDRTKQLKKTVEAGLIVIDRNDRYGITIGGALLLARDIAAFPSLASARIRLSFGEEGTMLFDQGYIPFFISVTSLFDSGSASGIPLQVVTELVFVLLAYQEILPENDYGPVVTLSRSGLSGCVPGSFDVPADRLIDAPLPDNPVASFLSRSFALSGFSAIEAALAEAGLPSFRASEAEGSVIVSFDADRLLTSYQYACLAARSGNAVSNAMVRSRLGIRDGNGATVSRIMNDAVSKGMLRIVDPSVGAKARRYIPYWV